MALRYDYASGEMYDDGESDTFDGLPLYARDPYADEGGFGDVNQLPGATSGTGVGSGGGTEAADQAYRTSPGSASATGLDKFLNTLKGMGGKALNFAQTPQGIMTLLAAFAGLADKRGASGGGTKMGMPAPRQFTRTMTQGQYGPIARYAAEGGLMQAYAQGGEAQAYAGGQPLMMEDGGFVFTRAASDKLGPQGIAALGGKMISAPGNGTNDKGITGIIGKHGITPARVSDKESYFPEEAVEANGGPERMYAKMNALQRKA